MVDTIEKLNLSTLDKSGWKTYRFDQIAKSIGERVDPTGTDLDIYVGLEHIDSDAIHITRFGKREDVTGTKLRCYPGDVIFGRRRAYQRKAAIVEFDGFCSAHSLVLRANQKVIDPKLFPFFLHSDTFMNRAIDISVGSLSPTINWGTLKTQQFLLPPLEQQANLAQLLWAGDEMIESEKNLLELLENLLAINTSNSIWKANLDNAELKLFADKLVGKFVDGDWIESKDQSEDGIRLLQLADIGVNHFINKSSRFISDDTFKRLKCFEVLPGDIIIARMPDPIGRACRITDVGKRMITAVDCCIVRVDEKINDSDYLLHLLNSKEFLAKATSLASGSTRQRVSKKVLESVLVPIPNRQVQTTIAEKLNSILHNITSVATKLAKGQALQKALIKEIFG
jgi:type I restriction enzyme S subunit